MSLAAPQFLVFSSTGRNLISIFALWVKQGQVFTDSQGRVVVFVRNQSGLDQLTKFATTRKIPFVASALAPPDFRPTLGRETAWNRLVAEFPPVPEKR